MRYDFMIVDVFTNVAFDGNQLAVLTDARGLTSEAMQTITREFDASWDAVKHLILPWITLAVLYVGFDADDAARRRLDHG